MSLTPEAEWFSRRRDPENARRTEDVFQSWLLADPENVVRYAQCELAWERASELAHDPDIRRLLDAANGRLPATLAEQPSARPGRRPMLWAAAALVVLAITGAITFRYFDPPKYQTARGEQRDVVLADGSRVTLNTATQIVVRYTDDLRRILLVNGEALFDVNEDAARPFEVVAGLGVARAIGTRFAVRRSVDAITVSVLDGVVEVVRGGEDSAVAENLVSALEVGQAALLGIDGTLSAVVPANVRRIQAWQNRKIEFDNEPLAAAIAEVNRYSSKPFVLGEDGLSDVRVSGVFLITALQGFEFALGESLGLRVVENGGEVVILAAERKLEKKQTAEE
jgi:transmembrane sensor